VIVSALHKQALRWAWGTRLVIQGGLLMVLREPGKLGRWWSLRSRVPARQQKSSECRFGQGL